MGVTGRCTSRVRSCVAQIHHVLWRVWSVLVIDVPKADLQLCSWNQLAHVTKVLSDTTQ